MLGSLIWKDVSEAIIKDNLAAAVPNSNSQVRFFCPNPVGKIAKKTV